MSKTYITKYVHEIMGQHYRTYRYDLHQHFKQFETVEEARLHPPDDVTQEDWDYLCNLFSLEKFKKRATINSEICEKLPFNHRGGSKPFAFHRQHNSMSVATGELQGEVELFRATHYNESKGWINDTTKSRYEEMLFEILDELIFIEETASIAAVIKTLSTFLKTSPLKIELGSPKPFQATIIMARKHK
ncbi:hypothetical protein VitviT2T_022874 [Vitis vinifera]|nr:hypothetical protein VitviT2T_022874 [Vitis vinifera]